MTTKHQAPRNHDGPTGDASPRRSRRPNPSDVPMAPKGLAIRGVVVIVGLYLGWLGVQGSPLPGFGGDERAAWLLAGPGAWCAQSVVALAVSLFAVLVGGVGLLSGLPIGGADAAAFRTRLRGRFDLIMFTLAGAIFTVTLVVLAVLWRTGVAYRNYEAYDAVSGGVMYGILIGVCALVAGIGWAMVLSFVRGPARTVQPGERLPMSRLLLRPFGYLAMGTIWVALWLLILALAAALPVAFSDRRPVGLADGPLSAADGIVDLQENPLTLVLVVVLLLPLLAALFGWIVGMLPLTAWPLAALSFVYVVRSLRPSYAGEALSRTTHTNEAIGLPTVGGTALSLLPVRSSRVTDLLVTAYSMGWTPSFAMIKSCFWLGLGYLGAIVWFTWPVTNPALVAVYSVVCLGLAGYSVYRLVGYGRAILPRPARKGAQA